MMLKGLIGKRNFVSKFNSSHFNIHKQQSFGLQKISILKPIDVLYLKKTSLQPLSDLNRIEKKWVCTRTLNSHRNVDQTIWISHFSFVLPKSTSKNEKIMFRFLSTTNEPPKEPSSKSSPSFHPYKQVQSKQTVKSKTEIVKAEQNLIKGFRYLQYYSGILPVFCVVLNHAIFRIYPITSDFYMYSVFFFIPLFGIGVPWYIYSYIYRDGPLTYSSNRKKNFWWTLLALILGTFISSFILQFAMDFHSKHLEKDLKIQEKLGFNVRYNKELGVWEVDTLKNNAGCFGGRLILVGDFLSDSFDRESLTTREKLAIIDHERGHIDTFRFFLFCEALFSNLSFHILSNSRIGLFTRFLGFLYYHFFTITWISWMSECLSDLRTGSRGFNMLKRVNHTRCSKDHHSLVCRLKGFCSYRGEFGMGSHPPLFMRTRSFELGDKWYPRIIPIIKFLSLDFLKKPLPLLKEEDFTKRRVIKIN